MAEAAPNKTVPAPQRLPGVEEVSVGRAFMVAITTVRGEEEHVPEVAST